MYLRIYIFITVLIALCLGRAFSQPDFSQREMIAGTIIYPDIRDHLQWYYVPGPIKLIKDVEGKPEFRFVQMRYTGTKAGADQGTRRFNSIIKVGLSIVPMAAEENRVIREQLEAEKSIEGAKLLPMPLRRVSSKLIFAQVENGVTGNHPQMIGGGFIEPAQDAAKDEIWYKKTLTQRLEPQSSQAFRQAFLNQQNILSIVFTIEADGYKTIDDSLVQEKSYMVRSESLPVTIDHQRWPDLISQVDINESIPAEYAALDVYCFDFNNEIRDDLYAKQLEIKASGVGKEYVKTKIKFKASEPDVYARSVRFPYAVHMNRPFLYRILEIKKDGELQMSPWKKTGFLASDSGYHYSNRIRTKFLQQQIHHST